MTLIDRLGRYTCSACGAKKPWGETWRWKIADEYQNDVRRLLTFCSDGCAESPYARAADGTWRHHT